ncbi:MAG: sigma-70 family RNA polymerase sigma factor [Clostridium butyricum]|uniref:sigma-70 family RNA polymerase sigma factor n=1 Tax=Clostridium sp. TaxID=1506 RepID=UPI002900A09C|nr:sigma-70 family RNA polymerase sigma factor [Clostridium sp.]MDU1116758.1 sigma-70 family RNA polymerase sigma factor [Clostridium sp.]MDU7712757.1 sigma-70 family RNA polymerase sigma factor [Clostridium butyricum]
MNYDYIENLVKKSKDGDEYSKEKLIEEFKPFIINLSKRTFIPGYDFDDFRNECYRILFRCILLYKIESHRFVAYATNGIKNSINDLIRTSIKNSNIHGSGTTVYDNYIEETYKNDEPKIEEVLCSKYDSDCLKYAMSQLTEEELHLVDHLFYQNKTLKSFADKNKICYSYAVRKKRQVLDKLFMYVNIYLNPRCTNESYSETPKAFSYL